MPSAVPIMRLSLLFIAFLSACSAPAPNPPIPPISRANQAPLPPPAQSPTDDPPAPIPKPPTPLNPPSFIRTNLDGIAIEAVTFDSRSHFLAVVDQPGGPGSKWPDCRAAAQAFGGIAAINAGFFTPEGSPLGKVIADGVSAGQLNRASSLGAGFYVRSSAGNMNLIRRDRFNENGTTQALQAGPLLVENQRAVTALSDKQSSARSFVASDGGTRWTIARTGPCSLRALALALAGHSIGSSPLTHVLNLDGGRSSEIWASESVAHGPHFERPFWNKPVRNYLVIRPIR